MELRHLRYFVALAEHLSFTSAAERVHVAQSTLSHQIKQLEEEVGVLLFERIGKRVHLTPAGETFLAHAQSALREVDAGLWSLKEASADLHGEITIGATHTFNMRIIPACVSTFMERHPSVKVTVFEYAQDELADALEAERLDLAIGYKPHSPNLRFEPLYDEELVLVVSPSHPLAHRRSVRMVELHLQRLALLHSSSATRQLLDRCFSMARAEPAVVVEMNAIAPMIELASRTDIGTIVSEHAVLRDDVRVIPIESPTPIRTPGLLWHRARELRDAPRQFASIVQAAVRDATH
ncbi:LysR substrate-binding domain-containing protein [Paraburkholderia sediminicola]|uniref:LysR substrate-binding domain-containing protein n=1 Tax=Paraburkholderia sediminicola TaxID=458836 RepID=UPI0038BA642E